VLAGTFNTINIDGNTHMYAIVNMYAMFNFGRCVVDACKGGLLAVLLLAGGRAADIADSDVPVLSLVQLENMPAVVGHNAQTVTCLFFVGAGDHSKSEPAQ
jgi:hypothetical protein